MTTPTSKTPTAEHGQSSPELAHDNNDANMASVHTDSRESSASPDQQPDAENRPTAPIQKRRRVTRACDECRRKKIKCDGKQPCTHCTVYSYECTYDQPSNRRRNPAPQYIEALEQRLHKAEAILRTVLPGLDLEDPKFDAHGVDQLIEASKVATIRPTPKGDDDAQMQSMVDQAASLDLDDTGHWDFHGQSSGYVFMRRFRAKFGDSLIPIPHGPERRSAGSLIESPKSMQSSPFNANGVLLTDLPPREMAISYCRSALDDCCALSRPLHKPLFYNRLNALYDTDAEFWTTEHMRFLPLLYVVMALGCLFTPNFRQDLSNEKGYEDAVDQGYQFFNASKSLIDITDCRDLTSIQTVTFMILFLQGSAKLSTCYSYIGIALRGCCRLGMHRKVNTSFNAIEQEERKRIFWCIRKLDTYVNTMLGLPSMLSDDDIDQDLPAEIHDDYIREEGLSSMPTGLFPLMKATNAHTKLFVIMRKVLAYVYPLRTSSPPQSSQTYTIGHSRIRELEKDLQLWMDQLPMELRPADGSDAELSRVQQLLRISYAYVQMMMYRPFLHYVSPSCQTGRTDKRSFACAAACVSVARNIVHITSEMRRRNLLSGSYWFVMYITYFAILVLVYFVLENPDSTTSQDILKDAREGRETLSNLARQSMAADRCSFSLQDLFEQLPEKLNERRSSLQSTPNTSRKRPQPIMDPTVFPGNLATAKGIPANFKDSGFAPHRTRSIPADHHVRPVKKNSLPTSPTTSVSSFSVGQSSGTNGTFTSPKVTPSSSGFDWSAPQIQQGNFPDLKTVMFPSDNPFAYGNQPISTLEESQFGGTQDMPVDFADRQSNQFPQTDMQQSQRGQTQPHSRLTTNLFGAEFNGVNQVGQGYNQGGFGPANVPGFVTGNNTSTVFNVPVPLVAEPDMMQAPSSQQGQGGVDYWNQMSGKPQFRTGLTPGGPTVNLEEIFGGNGWGPVNMGMDLGTGYGNSPSQENMASIWPGANSTEGWQ